MSEPLSLNTKAILLLTAPLIAGPGKREKSVDLLAPGEYTKLALSLQEEGRQPADLLTSDVDQLPGGCLDLFDKDRLKRLLDRGFLLSQAVEHWQTRAMWVVSVADDSYPRILKTRLKKESPVLLYGCGDGAILNTGGLAVVGSRNANNWLVEYTHEIGRLTAKARRTMISGAARGIDQAAMRAALEAGGKVAGVLADGLEKTVMNREHRNLLLEGSLVLISPYDPNAGFSIGHAMQRNKVIYALADAALVVNADVKKGGTWAGAAEQLEKLHLVSIYVRSTGQPSEGLEALKTKGAIPWPDPKNADDFEETLRAVVPKTPASPSQSELSFDVQQKPLKPALSRDATTASTRMVGRTIHVSPDPTLNPAEKLYQAVRSLIVGILAQPQKASDVAEELGVNKRQADLWIQRLVAEGVLEKCIKPIKPVRYVVRPDSLFGEKRSTEPTADADPTGHGK